MTKKGAGFALILWLLFTPSLYSDFTCSSCNIDAPRAYVLPHNTWRGVIVGSWMLKGRILRDQPDPRFELDFAINYGLLNRWEFTLNVYTIIDPALDIAYQIRPETDRWPAVAVGVRDINWKRHISSVGGGYDINGYPDVWSYDKYYYSSQGLDPSENLSFYGILSKVIFSNFRINWGLGRGRFVGYGPNSRFQNIDCLFFGPYGPKHDWAIGWFGSLEFFQFFQSDWFSLAAEYDGRDANFGLKYRYGMLTFNAAMDKIEAWFWGSNLESHRMSVGLALQYPSPEQAAGAMGIVSGKVYDEATSAPLGAVLRVLGTRIPEVKADSLTGAFEIPNVPAGTVRLLVVRPGYRSREFQFIVRPNVRYSANLPLKPVTPPPGL